MATLKNAVFAVLWIGIVVSGIVLGSWQLDRLAWKTAWLERIDSFYINGPTPQSVNASLDMPTASGPEDDSLINPDLFLRWDVAPKFIPHDFFLIRPRVNKGILGGHLFQSATLPNGHRIWINRGFVPDGKNAELLSGPHHMIMQIRYTDILIDTVLQQNTNVSREKLCKSAACGSIGYIGVVEETAEKSLWPIPVGTRPNPPNDHLQYAIFWFVMSAVALAIGIFLIIRRVIGRA